MHFETGILSILKTGLRLVSLVLLGVGLCFGFVFFFF